MKSLTPPDPTSSATLLMDVERSRVVMARTGDGFRIVMVLSFWVLHWVAGYVLKMPDWHGNLDLWSIYLGLAVAVYLASRRVDWLARRSVRLIPFLDMPMLWLIQADLAPRGDPPSAIVGFTAGGYVLLILWTAMALEPRLTFFSATVAGILQAALFKYTGSNNSAVAVSLCLMISAGVMTVFVVERLGASMSELVESRVRREEAERSLIEKDRFVSTVSHDFRSPLAVLLASLQTLKSAPDMSQERRSGFLDGALRQCRRLMSMTEDLLRLASLGTQPLAREPVGVGGLLDGCVESLRGRAEGVGVHLALEVDEDVDEARGDRSLLERAIVNLLDNALRFTPPGGHVTVSARREGDQISISVEDDGPGIDPSEHARVFEPFYQVKKGPDEGGTGLGLAIVREVAQAHGGSVELASVPNAGSRFSLRVPRTVPSRAR